MELGVDRINTANFHISILIVSKYNNFLRRRDIFNYMKLINCFIEYLYIRTDLLNYHVFDLISIIRETTIIQQQVYYNSNFCYSQYKKTLTILKNCLA